MLKFINIIIGNVGYIMVSFFLLDVFYYFNKKYVRKNFLIK